MKFDGNRADLQSNKAAMYSHPIQTKNNGIIFIVQILAREFYMHVLILIFSKWNTRYHGNGRTLASRNLQNANKYVIYQFPRIRAKSVIFDFPRYYWPILDAYSQRLFSFLLMLRTAKTRVGRSLTMFWLPKLHQQKHIKHDLLLTEAHVLLLDFLKY